MMGTILPGRFTEIWLCDFEFDSGQGERPNPVCAVFKELKTGQVLRLWQSELRLLRNVPISTDDTALLVAYYASAELGCFEALGWQPPTNVLDLYAEFRVLTNGRPTPSGRGLLGALVAFGLDAMSAHEKDEMRDLVLGGGPWSAIEKERILNYCEQDVLALESLFIEMLPHIAHGSMPGITFSRALLRGRYMKAAAKIEYTGVPIDTDTLASLREHWDEIKNRIVERVNGAFDVFEGTQFREERFSRFLSRKGIPWIRTETGQLALDDDTFRMMAKIHPEIATLREVRHLLSQLRLNELAVGKDGRNRCLLSAFQAKTGRNQPSNTKFIFGPAVWLRGLIKPAEGFGLAYIDYKSQEVAIAAALSQDEQMMEAYQSGDPYLSFAVQAGLAPPGATKASHGKARNQCKALVLGLQYGMTEVGLGARLNISTAEAARLMRLHRQTYPKFWRWSQSMVDHAHLGFPLYTTFGWPHLNGDAANPRSLRNFPMQANGAEMLRLACCLGTEAGISICAPVHDALLIEAPLEVLGRDVDHMRTLMVQASRLVLGGFEVSTSAEVVWYPERYMDEDRGRETWNHVMALLKQVRGEL